MKLKTVTDTQVKRVHDILSHDLRAIAAKMLWDLGVRQEHLHAHKEQFAYLPAPHWNAIHNHIRSWEMEGKVDDGIPSINPDGEVVLCRTITKKRNKSVPEKILVGRAGAHCSLMKVDGTGKLAGQTFYDVYYYPADGHSSHLIGRIATRGRKWMPLLFDGSKFNLLGTKTMKKEEAVKELWVNRHDVPHCLP